MDTCAACGAAGEPCCAGNMCTGATLACANPGGGGARVCEQCGGTGQPCCAGNTSTTGMRALAAADTTRHDPVTDARRAKAAIFALEPGEYVDVLATIIPTGYELADFDITPSDFTPFMGRFADKRFLRVSRR